MKWHDIQWYSYFISMLYEEFEDKVIGERSLQFGRELVWNHCIE